MKYYSEATKKFYDTEDACTEAEAKYLAEIEAKEIEAKKKQEAIENEKTAIKKLYEEYQTAKNAYYKAVSAFNNKYGSFKTEWTGLDSLSDLWKFFIND